MPPERTRRHESQLVWASTSSCKTLASKQAFLKTSLPSRTLSPDACRGNIRSLPLRARAAAAIGRQLLGTLEIVP